MSRGRTFRTKYGAKALEAGSSERNEEGLTPTSPRQIETNTSGGHQIAHPCSLKEYLSSLSPEERDLAIDNCTDLLELLWEWVEELQVDLGQETPQSLSMASSPCEQMEVLV